MSYTMQKGLDLPGELSGGYVRGKMFGSSTASSQFITNGAIRAWV